MATSKLMDEAKLQKYKTVMCQRMLRNSTCRYALLCDFAHDLSELRRNLSQQWYYGIKCEKNNCSDKDCMYAHNEMELMYHPQNFKTQLCQAYEFGGNCPKKILLCICAWCSRGAAEVFHPGRAQPRDDAGFADNGHLAAHLDQREPLGPGQL